MVVTPFASVKIMLLKQRQATKRGFSKWTAR